VSRGCAAAKAVTRHNEEQLSAELKRSQSHSLSRCAIAVGARHPTRALAVMSSVAMASRAFARFPAAVAFGHFGSTVGIGSPFATAAAEEMKAARSLWSPIRLREAPASGGLIGPVPPIRLLERLTALRGCLWCVPVLLLDGRRECRPCCPILPRVAVESVSARTSINLRSGWYG